MANPDRPLRGRRRSRLHPGRPQAKRVSDGSDFFLVNPDGQVPALRTSRRDADRRTRRAAIRRRALSRCRPCALGCRAAIVAAMAELHRLGAAQAGLQPAARPRQPRGCQGIRPPRRRRPLPVSRAISPGGAICSTAFSSPMLPHDGAELERAGRARPCALSGGRGLSPAHAGRPSVAKAVAEERALYAAEQSRAPTANGNETARRSRSGAAHPGMAGGGTIQASCGRLPATIWNTHRSVR